jgi:hypothetical protein
MIKYLKNLWNSFWSKTDLDEKAIAVVKEVKTRTIAVKKEMVDVVDAAKGKKKKTGKKPYYKNKKKTNNNKPKK